MPYMGRGSTSTVTFPSPHSNEALSEYVVFQNIDSKINRLRFRLSSIPRLRNRQLVTFRYIAAPRCRIAGLLRSRW
jgi:hypothetical protein